MGNGPVQGSGGSWNSFSSNLWEEEMADLKRRMFANKSYALPSDESPSSKYQIQGANSSIDYDRLLEGEESNLRNIRDKRTGQSSLKDSYHRLRPDEDLEAHNRFGSPKGCDWLLIRHCNAHIYAPKNLPESNLDEPEEGYKIEYAYGYRCEDSRQNVYFTIDNQIVYPTAALGVVLDPISNVQKFFGGSSFHSKNLPSGEEHNDDILSLAINSKRDLVVSGQIGSQPKVLVWSPSSCKLANSTSKQTLPKGEKGISAIGISYDSKYYALATLHNDHNIYVIETETSSIIGVSKSGPSKVLDISWSMKEGDYSFVSVGIKHINMWNLKLTQCKRGDFGRAKETNFSCSASCPKGRFYTGGANGFLYVWEKDQLKDNFQLHNGIIYAMKYSMNVLLTGGKDECIKMIDIESLKVIKEVKVGSPPKGIDYNGVNVVVGCLNGSIYLLDKNLNSEKKEIIASHCMGELWGLDLTGKNVITTGDDNQIIVWDSSNRVKVKSSVIDQKPGEKIKYGAASLTKLPDNQCSRAVCINPVSKEVIVATNAGIVQIRDNINELKLVKTLNDAKRWIEFMGFSPDCSRLAIGDHQHLIHIYELPSYQFLKTLKGATGGIISFDWSSDGQVLRVNSEANEILFFNMKALVYDSDGHQKNKDTDFSTRNTKNGWGLDGIFPHGIDGSHINSLSEHPNKKLVATGDDWGLVNLYRYPVMMRSKGVSYRGHSSQVTRVKFNSDGSYLFSIGGYDQTMIQWKSK